MGLSRVGPILYEKIFKNYTNIFELTNLHQYNWARLSLTNIFEYVKYHQENLIKSLKLPEHFINLPFDLKLKILDINFTLEIGGQQISNLNTFTGLFMDYCNKINPVTITNNNQLIIPMINFISMHGLPIVALQWHEIRVKINKDNILDDYKFRLIRRHFEMKGLVLQTRGIRSCSNLAVDSHIHRLFVNFTFEIKD